MAEMTHEDMWAKCQLLDKYLLERSDEVTTLAAVTRTLCAAIRAAREQEIWDALLAVEFMLATYEERHANDGK